MKGDDVQSFGIFFIFGSVDTQVNGAILELILLTFIFRLHGYAWFILYKYNHHLCWNKWFRRCFWSGMDAQHWNLYQKKVSFWCFLGPVQYINRKEELWIRRLLIWIRLRNVVKWHLSENNFLLMLSWACSIHKSSRKNFGYGSYLFGYGWEMQWNGIYQTTISFGCSRLPYIFLPNAGLISKARGISFVLDKYASVRESCRSNKGPTISRTIMMTPFCWKL